MPGVFGSSLRRAPVLAAVGSFCACGDGVDMGWEDPRCVPEWPSPDAPFRKPTCWVQPPIDFDPALGGSQLALKVPAGACVSPAARTYWLDESEDVRFDVVFGRGPEQFPPTFPELIRSVVLIDGVATRFSVDGNPPALSHEATLDGPSDALRFRFTVASADIPRGVHSLLFIPLGRRRSPLLGLTLVKASFERSPPASTPGGRQAAFHAGNNVRRRDGPLLTSMTIGRDDPLQLTIGLARFLEVCPNQKLGVMVVAMVDGAQVPLTAATPYLRADLRAKERVEFDVDLAGLPHDGRYHALRLFIYMAERELQHNVRGTFTPWGGSVQTVEIAGASWQD